MENAVTGAAASCPEHVAYLLFVKIAASEDRVFDRRSDNHHGTADRDWILSTYTECLNTVRGFHKPRALAAANVALDPVA